MLPCSHNNPIAPGSFLIEPSIPIIGIAPVQKDGKVFIQKIFTCLLDDSLRSHVVPMLDWGMPAFLTLAPFEK